MAKAKLSVLAMASIILVVPLFGVISFPVEYESIRT